MEPPTIRDAAQEAQKVVKPFEQKQRKRLKKLLNNAATIITIFMVVLTMVLFAFNRGYASVYDLPSEIFPVDIKQYLSISIDLAILSVYVFYYVVYKSADRILGKIRFNFLTVLYGCLIILALGNKYHFSRIIDNLLWIIIAIIVPIIVELLPVIREKYLIKGRNQADKVIDAATKEVKKEDFVWERIFYWMFVKSGIAIFVICIGFAPWIGSISAKANPCYQTCIYDAKTYAVVVEYDDKVLVQEAKIDENTITISTSSYRYLPKDIIELSYDTYDSVQIQEDF